MKSLTTLLLAVCAGAACGQVPSQTASQQAVVGPNNTPVDVRHVNELQVIGPNHPVMSANAAAARSAIPVKHIQLGANGSAHLQGSVRGLGMDTYRFSGNAGDTIRIISKRGRAMAYAIFRPEIGMRFGNYQTLPVSGEYELRIVNNRKDAAYNKTPRHYAVTFTLNHDGGDYAAQAAEEPMPAAERPVNATLEPASSVSYVCGTGGSLTAAFQPGVQAVIQQNGKTLVLPYLATSSTETMSKYGKGHTILTVAHPQGKDQTNPDIQQLLQGKRTRAKNCIPN